MDPQFVQNLRYKLQKRISRLKAIDAQLFPITLTQFWQYFDKQPVFTGIVEILLSPYLPIEKTVNEILASENTMLGDTQEEAAAIGYLVLHSITVSETNLSHDTIYRLAMKYGAGGDLAESVDTIREVFLEPFYEYVDEQLDDQRAMLVSLLRYKHRSEWFYREKLWELSQKEHVGERQLALDLYSYLYDQGIDFHIQPSSITGEIDLIAAQGTEDPLLLDAKVFDGDSRGKTYICKAFNQIYTYTQQYNEPFGYLMIYKITDRDLQFALPSSQFSNIPVVIHNHKTIFFITVDIYQYNQPVSQRPTLKAIEITQGDLITEIMNVA
jgi:hypothetical protein